jgi:hypothetical protein
MIRMMRGLVFLAALAVGAGPPGAEDAWPPPVTRRQVVHDERIGRVLCKAGNEAGVDGEGRLVFCTIARAVEMDGVPVAAAAYTLFHRNGRLYQTELAAPRALARGDGTKVACAAELVVLYDDGRLWSCRLAGRLDARAAESVRARDGAAPRVRARQTVSFHRDGRLEGATIDAPLLVGKLVLPAGTSVHWDAAGAVVGGSLAAPCDLAGLRAGGEFELDGHGALRAAVLAAPGRVQGHDLPAGAQLRFRGDGTLESASYIAKRGFMIHGEEWTDTAHVTYDPSGKITGEDVEHWQSEARHLPP